MKIIVEKEKNVEIVVNLHYATQTVGVYTQIAYRDIHYNFDINYHVEGDVVCLPSLLPLNLTNTVRNFREDEIDPRFPDEYEGKLKQTDFHILEAKYQGYEESDVKDLLQEFKHQYTQAAIRAVNRIHSYLDGRLQRKIAQNPTWGECLKRVTSVDLDDPFPLDPDIAGYYDYGYYLRLPTAFIGKTGVIDPESAKHVCATLAVRAYYESMKRCENKGTLLESDLYLYGTSYPNYYGNINIQSSIDMTVGTPGTGSFTPIWQSIPSLKAYTNILQVCQDYISQHRIPYQLYIY